MDNSVENMEIRLLEREKWRGFVLDMDYVACERYETRVSDDKDGSSITLTRRKLSAPESHTSKQYDYPDKLYQDHFPVFYHSRCKKNPESKTPSGIIFRPDIPVRYLILPPLFCVEHRVRLYKPRLHLSV